ncbi:MAG: tetratricopeptide repeat protein, partial [Candidatus Heimdallarchaeota archaeon]|nr:tetratricopeptide repeat protein [Candidatus Heimdallarchaeota archaeon]
NYEEILSYLLNDITLNKFDKSIYQSRILERLGRFDEAYQIVEPLLPIAIKEQKHIKEIGIRSCIIYLLIRSTKYDEALQEITRCEQLIATIDKEKISENNLWSLNFYYATILNSKGGVFRYQGVYNQAIQWYEKSIEIKNEIDFVEDSIIGYFNLAIVRLLKHDMKEVISILDKVNHLLTDSNDLYLQGYLHHLLGRTYLIRANFKTAIHHFEESIKHRRDLGNQDVLVDSLFHLALCYISTNNREEFLNILQECTKINNQSAFINRRIMILKALKLKGSSNLNEVIAARIVFMNFIADELVDWDLIHFALINICEILLTELKIFQDPEILIMLQYFAKKLLQSTKKQNAFPLLCLMYMFTAQLLIIELDFENAMKYLLQADFIAEEMELNYYRNLVTYAYDNLLDNKDEIERFGNDINKFPIMIEILDIENFLKNMYHQYFDENEILKEKPIFILLINNDFTTVYSKSFQEDTDINYSLIGSFLMATKINLEQASLHDDELNVIKYQQNTILFEVINSITLCYCYHGSTIRARQTLDQLINLLQKEENWKLIEQKIPQPKIFANKIEKHIERIFS